MTEFADLAGVSVECLLYSSQDLGSLGGIRGPQMCIWMRYMGLVYDPRGSIRVGGRATF